MSNEKLSRDIGASSPRRKQNWLLLRGLILFASGAIGGSALGVGTNMVNASVSPQYFIDAMGWNRFLNIWEAGIWEGFFEGMAYGAGFSIIFIALIAAMSHGTFQIRIALRYVLLSFTLVVLLWCIGGVIAVLYVWINPNSNPRFFGYQNTPTAKLAYAWVRGSIWGGVFGSPYAITLSMVIYALRYCRPKV